VQTINPIQVILWTIRRNEQDVIHLYNSLSSLMQITSGGNMVNFGCWNDGITYPLQAQNKLCDLVAELAELESATIVLDVGSGFGAPAVYWKRHFKSLKITCVNTNLNQLREGLADNDILFVNSTAKSLPFVSGSVDRVIALESAQHFKPLSEFLLESKRVLKSGGFLILAIPITTKPQSFFTKLGVLSFTWASEHYSLDFILSLLKQNGFYVEDMKKIGSMVYEPLAKYYMQNRNQLRERILIQYPSYIEKILFKSLTKMKQISERKLIDYALIKCRI